MLQTSNIEPRRSWRRTKYQHGRLDLRTDKGDDTCLSCGRRSYSPNSTVFCSDCLEWSRQSNIDEYWDDLGEPGG